MSGLGCVTGVSNWQHHPILASFCFRPEQSVTRSSSASASCSSSSFWCFNNLSISISFPRCTNKNQVKNGCLFALPDSNGGEHSESASSEDDNVKEEQVKEPAAVATQALELEWNFLTGKIGDSGILSSCLIGLLTGVAVVLFNNLVHEIRDFCWDGIPNRGASWLREEPIQEVWTRVILVPAFGGVIVALLNLFASSMRVEQDDGPLRSPSNYLKSASRPFLKALAASVTLGTGNSLGPEGPSVDIGTSIAKGVGSLFDNSTGRMLSLVAAGSAAGISSGFNAAVAGCFFAVEQVLWSSSAEASLSLTNTTSMVILSAVIGSVVSEAGLGAEPAFRVPEYDFRSPGELPLYLLLGILCGLVSLGLSRCTSYMMTNVDNFHKATSIPKASFPVLGGLSVGLMALAYPEILYWGFENVDILLESRPFVNGLSTDLLLQLIVVKIVATSLCRASGLVGGYYAPSLFIGAATGMAYGKLVGFAVAESSPIHLSVLEVASPQAYGLVGMAATLAGVCQTKREEAEMLKPETSDSTILPEICSGGSTELFTGYAHVEIAPSLGNMSEVESSICQKDDNVETASLEGRTFVSEAMKTRYVTVSMCTLLTEVLNLMLAEKQSCAVIVDNDDTLIGLLTLGDILEFGKSAKAKSKNPKELLVSELCLLHEGLCRVEWTATPDMVLLSAQMTMKEHGLNQVPVVRRLQERAYPVGILDSESISLTCSALAARECLG
ncbi:hypothetical protein L6164_037731 [Bauhinia variegata]|uniref:Uncharacterized protein n=1 Tax=Bauhinia variegata TaxID=167791 RepID=A0ACB9KL19_BAUVA|nr:hypothetical protein L6164_037731 [Bauhinia variegata]